MYCNHCGAVNPDDSSFCRACGRAVEAILARTAGQEATLDRTQPSASRMSSKEKRFPPIWPLLFIAALSFLLGNIELSREPEINEFIRVLVPFSGLCYWLYCVRRFHLAVVDVPGWNHPISPAQAVWLHLIPLYNFYWIFKWPAELANFVKWKTGSKAMGKYEVGIMLLIGGILGRMHASIALGFLFITAKYIEASLEKAFAITSNDQQ